jgi:DNA-binding NtrC family response regulator
VGDILVTDDDQTCRDSIQRVLEREGHKVQAADSVDAALKALDLNRFDLVVCDYRMPGKTGLDFLIELKRRQASVPVLMMSANTDALIEQSMLQLGALELIKKPIRRSDLIDRAAKAMGGLYVGPNHHL